MRPPRLAGRAPRLGVLVVASEVVPWAKTGGLADVVGALPAALEQLGHEVTIVLPRYRGTSLAGASTVARRVALGSLAEDVVLHVGQVSARRRVVMVDVPRFFDRDTYYERDGVDFSDNAERFGLLAAAALDFAAEDRDGRPVDVIHAHDWQAGLVPTLLRAAPDRYGRLRRAGTVFTIHNLAYQGLFAPERMSALGLPWSVCTVETGEFYGRFSFLKSGIAFSDRVTTVSPSYARETRTAEYGCGMEGVLNGLGDRYVGILNGIDTTAWNPATDTFLPARFDATDLAGKAACKRALLDRFGLSVGDDAQARPVIGMVSRLVEQKGLDLMEASAAALARLDATWILVGTGERRFERLLRDLAERHPTRFGVFIGFDEGLAHLVEAGADIFVMPSRFEPCGLNQMYSLRYGTVPVVRAVGGLNDTIRPYTTRSSGANGFKFQEASADALIRTLRQATRLFDDKAVWLKLVRRGMAADHSWETSAREYVKVYRRARQAAVVREGTDGHR